LKIPQLAKQLRRHNQYAFNLGVGHGRKEKRKGEG